MKKYLLALLAFTLVAAAACAQSTSADTATAKTFMHQQHHLKEYAMHHHGGMQKLNFTDAQKQQLKTMHEDYKNQLSALEKNDNITLKEYREKKASIEKERKATFESILTADQKNQMTIAKQKRMDKMKMLSAKRLDKMKTDLSLTDDQVAKIKSQHEDAMMQAKSIKENTSLTIEQKKEQLMTLRKSSKDNLNSILTADQLKKKKN